MVKPIPDWSLPAIVINFPGAVVTVPFWAGNGKLDSGSMFGVMQAISTGFWGGVAVAVEWFSCGKRSLSVNPPAPNLDGNSEST